MNKRTAIAAALTVAIVAVVLVPIVVVGLRFGPRPFIIPTGSMEPTLLIGDRIVARTAGNTFQRGDVAIFRLPANRRIANVKRIVAVPGDRLHIRGKQLFVNGATPAEPFVRHTDFYTNFYRDYFPPPWMPPAGMGVYPGAISMLRNNVKDGEVVVPAGEYFVLGDNRDNSLDSRYFGFVDAQDLIGKPVLVYFSSQDHVRWDRFFKRLP
jgi:signal peptidase I